MRSVSSLINRVNLSGISSPSRLFPPIGKKTFSTSDQIESRNEVLKKLALKPEDFDWPEKVSDDSTKVDYWRCNPSSIQEMYGKNDLSKLPIFKGGYINFGYWQNFSLFKLSDRSRVDSSALMYQMISERAGLDQDSRIIEVGCGLGFGCRYLMEHCDPYQIVGLDINEAQIARAKGHQKALLARFPSARFQFVRGTSDGIPFQDHSFSHVLSIEAAQHFPSLEKFLIEARRVLKPSGKLLFTTFFATTAEGRAAIRALIPDAPTHCSELTGEEVYGLLSHHLEHVQFNRIGEHVFPGLETWLRKIGYERQWTMLWPALYRAGLIDYFVFEAKSPSLTPTLKF